MAIYTKHPKCSGNGLWYSPEAISHLLPGFTLNKRAKPSPVLDPRMGHIWYYIPLCTIFPQKINGEISKNQFFPSKSSHQSTIPFSKEGCQGLKFGNHGKTQKTI
ncbi:hypothetical protein O181_129862 [Austropuccinia psidii MF-1]|uniref:Uncharacterized protein n=1 Tax=Austropuccinia psidii MF-1 TaxID=1389203 RepID=A0A9Q3L2M6_9BASI|nr:hypothetical protein [Austropuccinia psidii MF-1]